MNVQIIKKVEEWAEERGIYAQSTSERQLFKILEEAQELYEAVFFNDEEGIKDALGDIQVALISYCKFMKINILKTFNTKEFNIRKQDFNKKEFLSDDISSCSRNILNKISNLIYFLKLSITKPYENDKVYIRESIHNILYYLWYILDILNLNNDEILKDVYNTIKDRKGQMIGGKFIREK